MISVRVIRLRWRAVSPLDGPAGDPPPPPWRPSPSTSITLDETGHEAPGKTHSRIRLSRSGANQRFVTARQNPSRIFCAAGAMRSRVARVARKIALESTVRASSRSSFITRIVGRVQLPARGGRNSDGCESCSSESFPRLRRLPPGPRPTAQDEDHVGIGNGPPEVQRAGGLDYRAARPGRGQHAVQPVPASAVAVAVDFDPLQRSPLPGSWHRKRASSR